MKEITADTTEVQRIMKECYEQLYANKLDNLEEVNNFVETYNFPWLDQKETENPNRLITSNETEAIIKKLPTNKSPGPDSFTGELYPTFKEKLIPILLKLFQKH